MKKSRMQALQEKVERAKEKGRRFDLNASMKIPAVDGGEYMLDAMFALGPARPAGMAEAGTDYPVIESFARSTGRLSDPWEIETMFHMCRAFVDARETGKNPLAIEPVERG